VSVTAVTAYCNLGVLGLGQLLKHPDNAQNPFEYTTSRSFSSRARVCNADNRDKVRVADKPPGSRRSYFTRSISWKPWPYVCVARNSFGNAKTAWSPENEGRFAAETLNNAGRGEVRAPRPVPERCIAW